MYELERRLIAAAELPTIPAVARRILDLFDKDEGRIDPLADAITLDPALSVVLLRLINSPLYGLGREVVAIRDAVLYLGVGAVRSLALSFALMSGLRRGRGDERLDVIWQRSLMTALASRRLASEGAGWDAEEAFLGGLLADCGVIVLCTQLTGYGSVLERFVAGAGDLFEIERELLNTDRVRVTGLLLSEWDIPEAIRAPLEYQHEPLGAPEDSQVAAAARVLSAGWLYARALTTPGWIHQLREVGREVSELVGIPVALASSILADLPAEFDQIVRFFDLPASQQRSYEELLRELERISPG